MMIITESYGRDLDLNLLRVFAIVAEEGSITRAASRLYVTQPAVSASMRRLANFVGVELITRQGHGVALTTRGLEILAAARAHLPALVAATMAATLFDPAVSTATIRVGLADSLEAVLLPRLMQQLRAKAPHMQLVVLAAQFRTVEAMLLGNKVDFAVTVADELPRSIVRQPLGGLQREHAFVCLYDPRFVPSAHPLTKRWYFAREHVAVSYAGDVRGIVEDLLGESRTIRLSVPAFGYVADVVDGSALVATIPRQFARHILRTRRHLKTAPLPFALAGVSLDMLWSRVTDTDLAVRFVRELVPSIVESLGLEPQPRPAVRTATRKR